MKGHLDSGETYSLEQIFVNGTNGKMVIPDLQRDYCWGGKGTLVTDFVNNIKKHFEECRENNKDRKNECLTCINTECRTKAANSLMMGLLYGYYEENRPNLQLCDGQQRLTTLYLLIGLINRLCGDNSFRRFLISDFELEEDDKEPNLLYDIRDSSLYFLSDLVCHFFIQENREYVDGALSDYVRKQEWWFKAYETDPTIQSMLTAMDEMQKLLQDMDKLKLKDFGNYVCNMLQFVYFDMGDRKNGEKTFVIINTTGEPLTATENLKPLVVTQGGDRNLSETEWEENSRQWEEVDHWFWKNRDKSKEDTSDAGMKEFLRWVVALHPKEPVKKEEYYQWFTNKDYVFPYRDIGIKKIKEVFEALKRLNEDKEFIKECDGLLAAPTGKMYDLKEYFVLLPTLKHFKKFKDKDAAVRIYRFFRNLSRYTDISMDNNNVLLALKTIDYMTDKDVCSLLDLEGLVNTTYILTEEEKTRLTIIRQKATNEAWREKVEDAFERISTHQILSGRIHCLIACSYDEANIFDFQRFETNTERFELLFSRKNENVVDDKTALAFAAFCYERQSTAYPMAIDNYRDFGYYANEWNLFIYGDKNHHKEHIRLIGDFLHEIDEQHVETSENNIINRLSSDHPMYYLITKNMPCVLKHGEWHKRLSIHPASGLIRLFQNPSYRSDNKDVYLLGQKALKCQEIEDWIPWRFYNANVEGKEEYCLYTDHKIYDVAIDLLFIKISDNQYRLRIFKRNNSKKDLVGLEDLLEENSFSAQEIDGRMVSKPMQAEEIIKFIDDMKAKIQKLISGNDEN